VPAQLQMPQLPKAPTRLRVPAPTRLWPRAPVCLLAPVWLLHQATARLRCPTGRRLRPARPLALHAPALCPVHLPRCLWRLTRPPWRAVALWPGLLRRRGCYHPSELWCRALCHRVPRCRARRRGPPRARRCRQRTVHRWQHKLRQHKLRQHRLRQHRLRQHRLRQAGPGLWLRPSQALPPAGPPGQVRALHRPSPRALVGRSARPLRA